ncbi:MAG: DUF4870 domain-containing protein [Pontiella sp.]
MDSNEFNQNEDNMMDSNQYGTTKTERQWAVGCHLIPLVGYMLPIASVIAPLVLWLIKREDGAFIDEQGKESLNFQISILIYVFAATILIPVLGLGVLLLGALVVFDVICMIIAAIKASEGTSFRYPLCIRIIK